MSRKSSKKVTSLFSKAIYFIFLFYFSNILVLIGLITCSKASFSDFFGFNKHILDKFEDNNALGNCLPSDKKSKNIVVDGTVISGSGGGVTALVQNIIKGICKKRLDWYFTIICNHQTRNDAAFEFNIPNVQVVYAHCCHLNKPLLWLRSYLNFVTFGFFRDQITQLICYDDIYFNSDNCDLFFDPYAECIVNDYFSVPKISLIHDLLYRDMPDFVEPNRKIKLDEVKENAARILDSSSHFITVSEFSKSRILKHFSGIGQRKIDDSFVSVIPIRLAKRISVVQGVGQNVGNNQNIKQSVFTTSRVESQKEFARFILDKYGVIRQKYLIYPSVVRSRKNHRRLLRAFMNYHSRRNSDLKLVIAGTIHPKAMEEVYRFIEEESKKYKKYGGEENEKGEGSEAAFFGDIKNKVICTSFIPDEELSILLSNAIAMIFPSIYEGFGMPIIEAMEVGVPVACGNTTSIPEVAGDAALLFDPYKVDDIERAIETISSDKSLRKNLIKKGFEQAKKFEDQDAMINEYIEVFETYMKK